MQTSASIPNDPETKRDIHNGISLHIPLILHIHEIKTWRLIK